MPFAALSACISTLIKKIIHKSYRLEWLQMYYWLYTDFVVLKIYNVCFYYYRAQNVTDKIFSIIREMVPLKGQRSVKVTEVMEQCTTKGYKPDQVDACIEEYEELNVWQVNQAHTKITFI